MQRSILQHQIDNFHYLECLQFIKQHGDESFADRYLGMSRSSFTEKKVLKHLEQWLESIPEQASKVHVQIKLDGSSAPIQSGDIDDLKQLKNMLLAKRDSLKGQLELIPSNDERQKVALEIVSLTKQVYEHWQDINMLEAGNALPTPEPDDKVDAIFEGVTDKLQLDKIRRNHISYLSKARKGLRSKELIPLYEQVIAEAERRMK